MFKYTSWILWKAADWRKNLTCSRMNSGSWTHWNVSPPGIKLCFSFTRCQNGSGSVSYWLMMRRARGGISTATSRLAHADVWPVRKRNSSHYITVSIWRCYTDTTAPVLSEIIFNVCCVEDEMSRRFFLSFICQKRNQCDFSFNGLTRDLWTVPELLQRRLLSWMFL